MFRPSHNIHAPYILLCVVYGKAYIRSSVCTSGLHNLGGWGWG